MVCDSWDTQYCHDILRKEEIFYFQEKKFFYSFQKGWQIEVIRIGDSWYNIACVLDTQEGLFVWIMEVGIMQEQGSGIKKNFGEKIWKMGLFD